PVTKKASAKKVAVKKAPAKKVAVKKAPAKKVAAKKAPAKLAASTPNPRKKRAVSKDTSRTAAFCFISQSKDWMQLNTPDWASRHLFHSSSPNPRTLYL
ncbi:MAG: hypothetical protein ACKVG0_12205, partial [Alphaproteobacteria bacterium]